MSIPKRVIKKLYSSLVFSKQNIYGYFYLKSKLPNSKTSPAQNSFYLEALKKYPNSIEINRKLASVFMDKGDWISAQRAWKLVHKYPLFLKATDYKEYSSVLLNLKAEKEAVEIISKGIHRYPKENVMIEHFIKNFLQSKYVKKDEFIFSKIRKHLQKYPDIKGYFNLIDAHLYLNDFDSMEFIKTEAKNYSLDAYYEIEEYIIKQLIENRKWKQAISTIKKSQPKTTNQKIENNIKLAIIYKILGNSKEFNEVFNSVLKKHNDYIEKDENKFRKVVLFDNGKSIIEFYKNLQSTGKIMITFDSLNMVADKPSFAFRLLIKQGIDIIAVRKREMRGYQQDLKREDFLKVVSSLVNSYEDVMAYGFSLGAYQVLYHTTLFNCRVLTISPRLSIHPIYGKKKIIKKHKFSYDIQFEKNNKIAPTIVYDPKNTIDNRFVNEGILPKFPNAKLVKVPFSGHMVAPYLRDAGQLKELVINFIENKDFQFDKKYTDRPNRHYFHLASYCLRRGKCSWALNIIERYLKLEPDKRDGNKVKIKALISLNKISDAEMFCKSSLALDDDYLDYYLYLIDIYILKEDYQNAELAVQKAIAKFGRKRVIIKRKEKLKEAMGVE